MEYGSGKLTRFFFVFWSLYFGLPGTPYIFRSGTTFGFTMVLKTQGGTQTNNKKIKKWRWEDFEDHFFEDRPSKNWISKSAQLHCLIFLVVFLCTPCVLSTIVKPKALNTIFLSDDSQKNYFLTMFLFVIDGGGDSFVNNQWCMRLGHHWLFTKMSPPPSTTNNSIVKK